MAQPSAKKLQEQGVALFRKGKFEAALEKFNEALQAAVDQPQQAAEIYNDLGVTYKQLTNYPAAYQALDEAMTRFTQLQEKKGPGADSGQPGFCLRSRGPAG